jgi:hypothetical protein
LLKKTSLSKSFLTQGRESLSRGTTLIAASCKLPLNTESDNSCPDNGGRPNVPTKSLFQNISSGVYLHIRQHLLAPPAVSLSVGIPPNILIEDIFLSVTAFI